MKKALNPQSNIEKSQEKGQSLVEFALTMPLLLVMILIVFEMGVMFATYVGMANAAREGAVFASQYPGLASTTCPLGQAPPACSIPFDTQAYDNSTRTMWQEYQRRIRDDSQVLINNPLIAAGLQGSGVDLDIKRPVAPVMAKGAYITVTVTYSFTTFTSGASLPFFGRMGLPPFYELEYSFSMPIRGVN